MWLCAETKGFEFWKLLSDESPVWLSLNKNCRYPPYCVQRPFEVHGNLISDDILRSLHEGFDLANLIGAQDTRYIYSYLIMWRPKQILYTITQSGCLQAVWRFHGLDTWMTVTSAQVQRTRSPLQTDSKYRLHADCCRPYKDRETDMLSVKWKTDSN